MNDCESENGFLGVRLVLESIYINKNENIPRVILILRRFAGVIFNFAPPSSYKYMHLLDVNSGLHFLYIAKPTRMYILTLYIPKMVMDV